MVFINKKYGIRSLNGPLSDEVAKALNDFMSNTKEERMTKKKLTEEQYEEIMETQKDYFPNNLLGLGTNGKYFIESLSEEIVSFAANHDLENKMLAIANPLTREWAHDKFVEKEKRYFWKTKKTDDMGEHVYIELSRGLIALSAYSDEVVAEYDSFTKSEIIEAGYNPDMFDKEEVE